MFWKRIFRPEPQNPEAWALYDAVVAQARSPALYSRYGVPDSLDGRYEAIVLHLVLLLRRLKGDFPEGLELAEALQEAFFEDMDRSLREMGAGDLGVGKRVKRMAEGFLGRLAAYDEALDKLPLQGPEQLHDVLLRNVFGTLPSGAGDVAGLGHYVLVQVAALDAQDGADLRQGQVAFADPAGAAKTADFRGSGARSQGD